MFFNITLVIILMICIITDIKERKIYNKVIFPSLILALIAQLIVNGLDGLLFGVIGFLVGFFLLLIPYVMGGMGAGDVKLLALIGALKGPAFVVTTAIYMAVIGGIIALGILLFRKGVWNRLASITYAVAGFKSGIKIPLSFNKESMQTTYPYGVAIAGGAIISLVLKSGVL